MADDAKEKYLGLKVMRLLKPSFQSSIPSYRNNQCESDAFENILFEKAFNTKEYSDLSLPTNFILSDFLILPESFGNIFIGELFSSYICLHNHTQFDVRQLSVKVELQTKSQKLPLPLVSTFGSCIDEFKHDQIFDGIIQHAIKELGVHTLVCTVNYTIDNDEKISFKKFFKFLVSKPFEIQPKFPYSEDDNYVLFETQIQNVTNSILYMDKVTIEPAEGLQIEDLNSNMQPSSNELNPSMFGSFNYIKPTEIKQFLFRARSDKSQRLSKPITIGKLDIIWRNPLSGVGRLQTNPLTQSQDIRMLNKKEVELRLLNKNELCKAGESMDVDVDIRNISQRTLDLEIRLENSDELGYLWDCNLLYKLGKLASNESFVLNLTIVPTQCGHLVLGGIVITELFLKRIYDSLNMPSFVIV